MKLFLGIDNGVSGAIAAIDGEGKVVALQSLPVRKVGSDNTLDVVAFSELLAALVTGYSPYAIAEQAQKFSKGTMALASTWRCWGMIQAVLELSRYPWEPINPSAWQKPMFSGHFRAKDQDTKSVSIEIAGRIFPHQSLLPTLKSKRPDSGLADALLIAEFARRNR